MVLPSGVMRRILSLTQILTGGTTYLLQQLNALCGSAPTPSSATVQTVDGACITDVRGRGLMIGIELNVPYKEIRQRLLFEKHIFTGCAGTNVLRLLPPLCLSKAEADEFLENFNQVLA